MDVIYSRAAMLFARLKSTFNYASKESEAKVLNEVTAARLLVLDEIGECRESEWEGKVLANIVCQRHDDRRDTILISNQPTESFLRSVGDSITDRIAEGGSIYQFDWPSFRRTSA